MMVASASIAIAGCCRTKLGDGWSGDGMLCVVGGEVMGCCEWLGHHLPAGIYGFSGSKKNIKFYFPPPRNKTSHLIPKPVPT